MKEYGEWITQKQFYSKPMGEILAEENGNGNIYGASPCRMLICKTMSVCSTDCSFRKGACIGGLLCVRPVLGHSDTSGQVRYCPVGLQSGRPLDSK